MKVDELNDLDLSSTPPLSKLLHIYLHRVCSQNASLKLSSNILTVECVTFDLLSPWNLVQMSAQAWVKAQRQPQDMIPHILHLATGSRDYANPPYPPSEEGGQKLLCLHTQNPPTPF